MRNLKTLGLINALMTNRADAPALPSIFPAQSRGLLGLESGGGALPSFHTRVPSAPGPLAQLLARSDHDRLLEKLHLGLVANFYSKIKVDLPGHVKPDRIVWTDTQRGHEPDATAYYGPRQYVFEVETADSLGDEHTYEQCRLFAAYVRNKFAEFVLVVPIGCGVTARCQLSGWGLRAAVLEI